MFRYEEFEGGASRLLFLPAPGSVAVVLVLLACLMPAAEACEAVGSGGGRTAVQIVVHPDAWKFPETACASALEEFAATSRKSPALRIRVESLVGRTPSSLSLARLAATSARIIGFLLARGIPKHKIRVGDHRLHALESTGIADADGVVLLLLGTAQTGEAP